MSVLDNQVGGNHYKKYKYQPIEYFMDARLNPLSAKISKYIIRHRDKNGIEDLQKALHLSEIGIYKYIRDTSRGVKVVSDHSLDIHNKFINQIDDNFIIEKDILLCSLYDDYKKCHLLILDLINNEYLDKDNFNYLECLTKLSKKNNIDIHKSVLSRREDGDEFLFMLSFIFVLHKYDLSISYLSKSLKCSESVITRNVDKAYSMLEENNNSFIFEMETMFNHIESERSCKK